jgi:hypothetical protein
MLDAVGVLGRVRSQGLGHCGDRAVADRVNT